VQQVEVAVIGTGWCGGIRAETLSRSSLVDKLHICEIRPDRLAEVKALTNAATATSDYRDILNNDRIKVVYGIQSLSDRARLPQGRQACAVGKADRA
jgi:predicted dehydrogenase